MMSVEEYANDVKLTVAEVIKEANKLGIEVKKAEDMLSDEDIILLDNIVNLISTEDEIAIEDEIMLAEKAEDIVENSYIDNFAKDVKLEKLTKKNDKTKDDKFLSQKKAMYKNKEKLKKNDNKDQNIILYKEDMTVGDLAAVLNVNGTELVKKLISLGLMKTLNDSLDFETAEIIVLEYKKVLKREETRDISNFEEYEIIDKEEDLISRPPVVTIMGHVDHGKTTLLDYIRHSHVVDTESGGITQHIGAYQINYQDKAITFIDTPGHEAFTEMRARGAKVTDIVIIIVAADDGVTPQTKEAIDHAKSANVPIIVAVNKIDKPNANPDKVMSEMGELGIIPESWGGNTPFIKLSAVTGEGVDLLLENILAISEIENYRANPNRYAVGTVIESKQDKNIGGVVTLLIQNGTLRLGDPIAVGTTFGKVRTMKNDLGENIVESYPSSPVSITGLNANPSAGDKFMAFEKETEAKEVATKRLNHLKESKVKKTSVNFDDLFAHIKGGNKEINVVLKADVRGSEEAVKQSLEKIDIEGVKINVIRSGIGNITESDVLLASASNALIIGFNVIPSTITKEVASGYGVEIRLYTIIYKVVEEMELAMKGMLDPTFEEKNIGEAEVLQLFKFSKVGTIAGCIVRDGLIKSNSLVRVVRDGLVIHEDKIASLQKEKASIKEIKKGMECGITLENFNDLKEKDILSCYEMVEVKR
ncbi:MAG TPA: translation initiation factor IF-2 [Bacilli bacterium]|nr:translation initiation factor IF-2 [Bacilli bacterium]